MILYQCDLCKTIVTEKNIKWLGMSREYGMDRDSYDICEECANKIKNIAEGKINEDVWANIYNPVCDSSDDVHRGKE